MIERKKRLRFIQLTLLIVGVLIIYFVYYGNKSSDEAKLVSQSTKKNIKKDKTENTDVFFNIEYTGLDMNGNRYLLKSKEAYLDELKPEIIYMTDVNATFYFKDDTVLYVSSDKGVYNNKTLDMNFEQNVKANYLKSQLFAEKADYSNSKSYLSIYKNVKINDERGNLSADKLLFDITKKKLDITSFNNGNIDANVNLK
tara:strand:- start:233 stop:829 length:597 start_codon:yes stop_codon:yes gene_type:complete